MHSRSSDNLAQIKNNQLSEFVINEWIGENGIVSEYEKLSKEYKKSHPYHINLIDLLRPKANEPTHSRILGELLKQKKENEFQILNKFIDYLGDRDDGHAFRGIAFRNPEIRIEGEHIDIWIWDAQTGHALIIENKIHDAKDQPKQLFRYIEETKNLKHKDGHVFKDENIYIVYMPSDRGKQPSDQSFGKYKGEFKGRYIKVTYRELLEWLRILLRWLKRIDTSDKEIFLRSALEQYIDHLEGENMFQLHERFKTMNQNLKNLIRRKLELGELPATNLTQSAKRLELIFQKKKELHEVEELILEVEKDEILEHINKHIAAKCGNCGISFRIREDDRSGFRRYLDIPCLKDGADRILNVSIMHTALIYYGITVENLKEKQSIVKLTKTTYLTKHGYTRSDDPNELLYYYKELKLEDLSMHLQEILDLVKNRNHLLRDK